MSADREQMRNGWGIRHIILAAVSLAVVWLIAHTLLRPWFVAEIDGQILIAATAEKREESFGTDVRIREIKVNDRVLPLESLSMENGWEMIDGGICAAVLPQDETCVWFEARHVRRLEIEFIKNCGSGYVRIAAQDGQLDEFDLFSEEFQDFSYAYYVRGVSLRNNPVRAAIAYLLVYLLLDWGWEAAEEKRKGGRMEKGPFLKIQWKISVYYLVFAVAFWIMDIADSTLAYWDERQVRNAVIFFYLMTSAANAVISCKKEKVKIKKGGKRLMTAAAFVILPPVLFVTFEIMQDSGWKNFSMVSCLGNYVVYLLIFATMFLLLGNAGRAVAASFLCNAMTGLVFFYVKELRGKVLLPADLFAAPTALSVAGNYIFYTTDAVISVLLFYLLAGSIALLWKGKRADFGRFVKRGGICVLVWAAFIFGLRAEGTKAFWNSGISYWDADQSYRQHGTLLSFVRFANNMRIKKPEGYRKDMVAELAEQQKEIPGIVKYPNLLVIMDEALADFSDECDYEEALVFMHSLQKNTVKGDLYVSVMGGSTANTEYEFLTGCSMAFFPSSSVPYAQYIREDTDSLAKQLKAYGYTALAVHPYYPAGYSRNTVYPKLGFEQSLFLEDFEEPEYLGPYISDRSSFDKVLSLYEQRDGRVFIFNVTMQNHSGYGIRNFENTITVNTGTNQFEEAEEYLTATRETDRALQELIEYLEKEQEDVAVVVFGDHRPALPEEFYSFLKEGMEGDQLEIREKTEFRVPFLIWANYDIGEKEGVELSANYLSAYMAEVLSIPQTGYQKYLNGLRQSIPVMNTAGYKGDDGKWHYYGEDNEYSSLISEYEFVQYNYVHDQKGKVTAFFEP